MAKVQNWEHAQLLSPTTRNHPNPPPRKARGELLTPEYFASNSMQLKILPTTMPICNLQLSEGKDFRDRQEKKLFETSPTPPRVGV